LSITAACWHYSSRVIATRSRKTSLYCIHGCLRV